jgi:carboxyl-terminal processing protease
VILVDQGTARAAEILAAALHDHDAGWLLGTKTFGLCGLTKVFPLEDGSALVMTVAQCYTPKGVKITGKGLDPDVAAKTPEGAEAAAKPPKTLPPDQDPWVFQAVEVLKAGKPTRVAQSDD